MGRLLYLVVINIFILKTSFTDNLRVRAEDVTYDGRSLIIDGRRRILFSGSIHYPRSTPEMWESLIATAKGGGLDVIQTYVFWNLHESQPGQYDFTGRRDIVRFIKLVQAQGLYACLRIGPFIQAEWSYGGFPFWLHDTPGIVFRSDNEPFKAHMQNFTAQIVGMMKAEKLFASQGGPIILSQIENEYGMVEKAFGERGPAYVKWAAQMAVGIQTAVPWVMCKQNDAPDPVINSCNGLKCGETFSGPNSPNKPSIWTENWTTHYAVFGEDAATRSAADIAYHVALFILAKNGTFVNYYMYHGGTNFGRTASAFVTTSYYDQAPIDEYGMIRQPKWGHLKELHAAVKLCLTPLLSGVQVNTSLGQQQESYVYSGTSGDCAAFLINKDKANGASVLFRNASYDLPPQSISILPDCKNVAFNTAKVSTEHTTRTMLKDKIFNSTQMWEEFAETIPNYDDTPLKADTLLEHMNTTKDMSDYLWYTFRFQQESFNTQATLNVGSHGHVLRAFINGQFGGSAHGSYENTDFNLESTISLSVGMNNVSLLSVMVGLPDSGAHLERRVAGLRRVMIQDKDFTNYSWGYQVGLLGEYLKIFTEQGSSQIEWRNFSSFQNPLMWYKTLFDAPSVAVPVALNLCSMGKGEAWVNGQSIGRYWPSYKSTKGASQIWYHIPRSFLKPTGNLLVLFEEEGGNPLEISLDTASISQLCQQVSASDSSWVQRTKRYPHINDSRSLEVLHLGCPRKSKIYRVSFASYGTPIGNCGSTTANYAIGICHSLHSKAIVEKACLGKRSCSIPVSNEHFGGDPCPASPKSLLVVAECR